MVFQKSREQSKTAQERDRFQHGIVGHFVRLPLLSILNESYRAHRIYVHIESKFGPDKSSSPVGSLGLNPPPAPNERGNSRSKAIPSSSNRNEFQKRLSRNWRTIWRVFALLSSRRSYPDWMFCC